MTAPMAFERSTPRARGGGTRGFLAGRNEDPTDIGANVNRMQTGLQRSVEAFTAGAREQLNDDIGGVFGDLNAIGGIRNGGVAQGVRRATGTFATNVGREAAQTAVQGAQLGLDAAREGQRRVEYNRDDEFRRDRARSEDSQFDRRLGFDEQEALRNDRRASDRLQFDYREMGGREGIQREGIAVDRERIASGDRQAQARLDLDYSRLASDDNQFSADLDFRRQRAGADDSFRDRSLTSDEARWREGYKVDRERLAQDQGQFDTRLGFDRERAGASDAQWQAGFNQNERRFTSDDEFRRARAARDDANFDRTYDQSERRFASDDQFRRSTAEREFANQDREYNENVRRYGQSRADALRAEQASRKRSIWGAIGGIAGGVGGFLLGGPAGAAAGASIGGRLGG